MRWCVAILSALCCLSGSARAGLYYSGETIAELPAQWRGYLLDQRALRLLAVPATNQAATPLRDRYRADRTRLETLKRPLTADEAADLGALLVRFGAADKAVEVLRSAHRADPRHFHCAANLGTAWQLAGNFDQAIATLELAVPLAPPKWKKAEELHLKLLRGRRNESRTATPLDDLFNVTFAAGKKPDNLPGDAVSLMQTLGLWLPADGRILWQLGELAQAAGDVSSAAAILDGCVTEFGMDEPTLREHRLAFRALAGAPAAVGKGALETAHSAHAGAGGLRYRSTRPLIRRAEPFKLAEIRPNGVNPLPWMVLAETALDKPFRVSFHEHLRRLDGKRVVITGFIQPTGDSIDQLAVMLLEYPVGCWFCEVPEPTGIVLVEPPAGKTIRLTREVVRVEGRLHLNDKDPEEFLYTIREARVGPPE